MPSVQGSIRSINIYETFCCVHLLKTDNTLQYVLLWSYGSAQEDNAKNRLLHGMYLALARDAFLHNRPVELTYNSGSSLTTALIVK
jgi:hypothetical protein